MDWMSSHSQNSSPDNAPRSARAASSSLDDTRACSRSRRRRSFSSSRVGCVTRIARLLQIHRSELHVSGARKGPPRLLHTVPEVCDMSRAQRAASRALRPRSRQRPLLTPAPPRPPAGRHAGVARRQRSLVWSSPAARGRGTRLLGGPRLLAASQHKLPRLRWWVSMVCRPAPAGEDRRDGLRQAALPDRAAALSYKKRVVQGPCTIQPVQPLLDRRREVAALESAWESASRGKPQLVVVWGRRRVGKTFLTLHALDRLPRDALRVYHAATQQAAHVELARFAESVAGTSARAWPRWQVGGSPPGRPRCGSSPRSAGSDRSPWCSTRSRT